MVQRNDTDIGAGAAPQPDGQKAISVATIETVALETADMRREHDLLGEAEVPKDALWGIHTKRAVENFPITGVPVGHFPEFVRALAMVKQAAARANRRLGFLPAAKAAAIEAACAAIVAGEHHRAFVVDAVQGGAGTSTNMNANEVIANLGLAHLGEAYGSYQVLHPNDDVNMAQSTNDAYPTALRLAVILASAPLARALDDLAYAFKIKAVDFATIVKMGRTQLQDAVPMTLGQEFDAFHDTIKEDVARLGEAGALFREVNLGATAIGTGINADPRYASLAVEELARLSGQPMVLATNLIEATSDMGAFVLFSGVLKRIAVKISKICNDLRLLSSGPRAGFAEIRLPPVQAGSSIMPGKVNPVIPEVVNQVAFLVIGHDLTVTLCAEGGQLQLNAFEPTIAYCILQSMRMLTAALGTLTTRCVDGIEADRERCQDLVRNSISLVTALGPALGYEAASRIAKRALAEKRGVAELVLEEGLLTGSELDSLLELEAMTRPSRPRMAPVERGAAEDGVERGGWEAARVRSVRSATGVDARAQPVHRQPATNAEDAEAMSREMFVDGAFVEAADARISVMDRGFLFGDGIYEVTAVLDGRLVDNGAHLARLDRSLASIGIVNPHSGAEWERLQMELVRRNHLAEGLVYIQVTRGVAEREFGYSSDIVPTVVMFTQPKRIVGAPVHATGAMVVTRPDLRWARRDIKSVALLAQVMAKREAAAAGAFEVFMVEGGFITEGGSSTVFIVAANGVIVTRELSRAVLPGVTRLSVMRLVAEAGLTVQERAFTVEEAYQAHEVFFTSASNFVVPVVSIDGRQIGDGRPGPHTRRLMDLYLEAARGGAA